MKWQAAEITARDRWIYWRNTLSSWHRWWAWYPVAVPVAFYDDIVVPRHWVWLEYVARCSRDCDNGRPWAYKTYAGEPSRREMML